MRKKSGSANEEKCAMIKPSKISCVLICLTIFLCAGNPGSYGNVDCEDSPVRQEVALPMDYTAFPDIGFAYKFYPNRVSWNTARKRCAVEGANMAIVDSFKKVEYITGMVKNPFGSHTGIHRLYDGIEWISSKNDQPLAFIPWKPDANIKGGTGDCVALWNDGSGVGPWDCSMVLPTICEIPIRAEQETESRIAVPAINRRIAE